MPDGASQVFLITPVDELNSDLLDQLTSSVRATYGDRVNHHWYYPTITGITPTVEASHRGPLILVFTDDWTELVANASIRELATRALESRSDILPIVVGDAEAPTPPTLAQLPGSMHALARISWVHLYGPAEIQSVLERVSTLIGQPGRYRSSEEDIQLKDFEGRDVYVPFETVQAFDYETEPPIALTEDGTQVSVENAPSPEWLVDDNGFLPVSPTLYVASSHAREVREGTKYTVLSLTSGQVLIGRSYEPLWKSHFEQNAPWSWHFPEAPDRGLSALVVDRDYFSSRGLAEMLLSDERIGHVSRATNEAEAIQILTLSKPPKTPEIIFLDIRTPGLDGARLARVFSSMETPPSVVFLTDTDDRAIDAYEVGAVDYLVKPVQPERLRASIDRIIPYRTDPSNLAEAASHADTGRVFLCHSSGDKERVRDLYWRLRNDGIDCWFDEEDLLPGQDWEFEIEKAMRGSYSVLACLSRASINKKGYVQKELSDALDLAAEQPEGSIFLIPVRLEDCEVPRRLSRIQYVDLFKENGYARLLRSLRQEHRDET